MPMADVLPYETPAAPRRALYACRWLIVLICVGMSFALDALVAVTFAAPGYRAQGLLEVVGTFALGPFSNERLGVDVDVNAWTAVVALALIALHPIRPRVWTAVATMAGFLIWWGLAWSVIVHLLP